MNFFEYFNNKTLDHYDEYNFKISYVNNTDWFYWDAIDCQSIEHIIKKNSNDAYMYAYWIKNNRWPEAEPFILKSPDRACMYAIHLIKERWLEAEPILMKARNWGEYCRVFGILR